MSDIKDNETFVKWHNNTYPEKAINMYSLFDLYKAFNEGLNIAKDSDNISLTVIKTRLFDILETAKVMAIQERTNEMDDTEGRDFIYAYDWFCDESRNIKYQLANLLSDIEKEIYSK